MAKEWVVVWQERVTNLLSRRFLGGIGAGFLMYLIPDQAAQIVLLYGLFVGGKIGSQYVQGMRNGHG